LLLVVNSTARANIEDGNRIGGFLKHDAEILNAQPEGIDAGQCLDVAGLRGRVLRILSDLGPDGFAFSP